MKPFEFLSESLRSPIISHRNRAKLQFFKECEESPEALDQLKKNLKSDSYDVVVNSLYILQALSFRKPEYVLSVCSAITNLAKRSKHFKVCFLSRQILINVKKDQLTNSIRSIQRRITPEMVEISEDDSFYPDCDYFLKFRLGNESYKYELVNICKAFRYDCKKAFKKVSYYMREMGYVEKRINRENLPYRWQNDFDGRLYETSVFYYSRNAIQLFLMWCVQNLTTSKERWEYLLSQERTEDPALPELLFQDQPEMIEFLDPNDDASKWFKKRVKKEDVYKLLNLSSQWVPLYEKTYLKDEEKVFERSYRTCFIKNPIGRLSRRLEFIPPYYTGENNYINDLPIVSKRDGLLRLVDEPRAAILKGRLIASYGYGNDEFSDYLTLFPAPEIIEFFNLKQKQSTLEFYKGKELVISCVNWKGGYQKNIDAYSGDRYELTNYGNLLLIKSKYLKKYLKMNNLSLVAIGEIYKRKERKYGGYKYDPKNTKYVPAGLKILKYGS